MKRLICWWFGCKPSEHSIYDPIRWGGWVTPCERCQAWDCSYSDMVGDTRHRRFVDGLKHWLWYRWRRVDSTICNDDDIPF